MKTVALLLALGAPLAFSQQGAPPKATTTLAERVQTPSYADMYCSGFITNESHGKGSYVLAGSHAPHQTQFHQGDTVFVEGSGLQEGYQLAVIRELHDPNRSPTYAGQAGAISALGQPYAELGRLRVTAIRERAAVARVEYSCAPIVAGDIVVPFQERAPVPYQVNPALERFPAAAGSLTARIVMAKDFDYILGTGRKVYLSAGADKGVKVGEYFRAVRNYDPATMEDVDELSYKVRQSEETQKTKPAITREKHAGLPRRTLAEMIVINVTPTSSTAMITYAFETVEVGDVVELEAGVTTQQPSSPQALQSPQNPPTVTCSASPSSVRSGELSTITAEGQSPDNRPLTYDFTASGGRIKSSGAQSTLDTTGTPPGPITVNCTSTDDRGLSATSSTVVSVWVRPAPPQASSAGSIDFGRDKRRPTRVDNVAKAILDDCALRLQQDPAARGVIVGNADPNEPNAQAMAEQRAANAKDYLVREKGIDSARLEVRTGRSGTQTVEIWFVPAGASF
jgi:outer membrane protein OmpA-like peptidoglycan-associated protein